MPRGDDERPGIDDPGPLHSGRSRQGARRSACDQFGGGVAPPAGGVVPPAGGAPAPGVLMSMSVVSPPPIPPPNTKYATTARRTSTTIAQTQLELPRSVPGVLEI